MGKIILTMQPEISPRSWKEFKNKSPRYSVAIDGYVADESKFDPSRVVANFNHHEKVNRLATRATCAQILMAIRMRFLDYFRDDKQELILNVFANDCDEDVCVSWFLLKYGYLAEYVSNPSLNRLVSIEDSLDSTSGAYPLSKDSPILREVAWVFEPYYRAKVNGVLGKKVPTDFEGIVRDVEHRIMAHITGRGESIPLDTRYKILERNSMWCMVDEIGVHARTGMMADGITSYVAVRPRGSDCWDYVIGKISPFVDFPVSKILEALNQEEAVDDKWGGSDIIGGSPRVLGSKLNPEKVKNVINSVLMI